MSFSLGLGLCLGGKRIFVLLRNSCIFALSLTIDMSIVNTESFDRIIKAYYPKIVGFASLLHSRQDAEDIAQDVFSTLWNKRLSLDFQDDAHLNAWLMKVARSRSIDRLRRKAAGFQMESLSYIQKQDLEWFEGNCEDLFERIGRKDLYEKILSVADELPEVRRGVFRLSYVNNFSSKEIAKIMNMPVRTVENHLYQSLKYLRNKIIPAEFVLLLCLFAKFF